MGAAASTKEDHHIAATVDVLRAQQMAHRSTYAAKVGLFQGQKAAKPLEQRDVMDLPLPELRERLRRVFADEPDQLEVLLQLLETAGEDAGAVRSRLAELGRRPPARAPAGACKRARALERLAARLGPAAARELLEAAVALRAAEDGPDHPRTRATRVALERAAAAAPDAATMTWLPPCGG